VPLAACAGPSNRSWVQVLHAGNLYDIILYNTSFHEYSGARVPVFGGSHCKSVNQSHRDKTPRERIVFSRRDIWLGESEFAGSH